MKNSAISILSTFSKDEIFSFADFLNSPFHNKNNKAVQLFEILRKFHPDYENEKLTKEALHAELYGNESYKESYIRNLFSDLKILAENFLLHRHISKSRSKSKMLIEELNSRDLPDLMNKKIDSFEKEINKIKLKDQEYYNDKLFVYDMKSFSTVDNTLVDDFRKDQIESVIRFSLICLMESYFHFAVEEQRVQIKHDFSFLKYVLTYIKNNLEEFVGVPLLMIYYYLWMGILEDKSEINFAKAKEYFKLHFDTLTQEDKKNIYAVMQVYYANKIDKGDISYNRKILDLLLEMLDYGVISHNRKNFINLNLYRNILILCFRFKEIEKLKKFVYEYQKFVRSDSRSTISAYSSAHLNFLEGNFEAALTACQKVDFNKLLISTNENLYYKMDVRTLMMKCFYELNSIESALSHIETFKQFLYNSKLMKEVSRKNHSIALTLVRDIIKLKLEFDDFKLMTIKNKILEAMETPGSEWMLEKIAELENENKSKRIIPR